MYEYNVLHNILSMSSSRDYTTLDSLACFIQNFIDNLYMYIWVMSWHTFATIKSCIISEEMLCHKRESETYQPFILRYDKFYYNCYAAHIIIVYLFTKGNTVYIELHKRNNKYMVILK